MHRPVVLVTGGAGFIGSHACLQLAEAGYQPVVVDNLRTGNRDAVKWGPFEQLDVRDCGALAAVIRKHRCDAVMHFAAAAYVGESVAKPGLYYDLNCGGMIALLKAMQDAGVGTLVFSSSCATYGVPDVLPITEGSPQNPVNPYGRSKLMCEQMISDQAAAGDLRFALLRYFNACGADPQGRLFERHDPETHLIPLVLMAASRRAPPLQVFGTDYNTPDGTCIRDYIHVTDLARAHVLALRRLLGGSDSFALNLGTGTGHSIKQIIRTAEAVTGQPVPWKAQARRPGDPPELVADTDMAARLLAFRPRHSTLPEIIRHAAPGFGLEACDDACL
ncbi:UDP-glucose 4-epimerase GalE [Leisingera sp. S132]|uniref:UDP-glucose 4-epimerase GalE n=1 Tax=Leisingera sp. S132 TaxID=2867016 RepID=UPI0021A46664|nr:UDP-glucose 4-epimerase GalE [Leisingera sp. S132]UWQ78063.1 UDP-glucose 4-epimerase GalE [Leisingera sp. S132]